MNEPDPPEDATDGDWFMSRLPDREVLNQILEGDAAAELFNLARTRAPVELGFDAPPGNSVEPEIREQFAIASEATEKLQLDRHAPLTPEEVQAMHTFVHLLARPALKVIAGKVPGAPKPWPEIQSDMPIIERRIEGVGRLDLADRTPQGTGWLVSENLIMTNNHVVAGLCQINPHFNFNWRQDLETIAPKFDHCWRTEPGSRPTWDSAENPALFPKTTGQVQGIRLLHPIFDLALLELEGDIHLRSLPIASTPPAQVDSERVYVCGYPAVVENPNLHPALIELIFGAPSIIKRVSPGQLRDLTSTPSLKHDASTLGGNSGSPILGFESHLVYGLHFRGKYGTANFSVPLWELKDDPLLLEAGLTFQ